MDRSILQYNARTWGIDEGLPHVLVQAITQTPDGYLWVGTRKGLARFDGANFTVFDTNNLPELRNSSITALCADREGALWIGTGGGGVLRLLGKAITHFGKMNGLAGDNVRVIYQGRDDALWIGTTTGMSRYEHQRFANYTKQEGLFSDIINHIYQDRDDSIWIAAGEGLNRLRRNGIVDLFAMPAGLPNDSVRGICQDRGGRVWIGSNNGLLWYNLYNTGTIGNFYAYNTRHGLSDSFVSAICEDRRGNFWVGTYSGLNRFRDGRFFNEVNDEGLPFDRVNVLFEDREDNMWVGSREGLSRLTPKRFFTYTKQQGLTHNNIMSVREDRNGSLWLATWGGGLDQMKDGRVTAYAGTNGFSRDLILSTCEARDGSLWIGADFDGGLTRLKNGVFTHYTWKDGLIRAALRVIHEDQSGNLWIGTSAGLSCLKDGKFVNYTPGDNPAGNIIRSICEDHLGNLWFGTEGGLIRWNDGKFIRFTTQEGLGDNKVIALYEDKAQNLWIGTGSGGLNRYKAGRFTAYTTRQGLFSDEIFEILEDDYGWLWMSSSKGIFRVSKRGLDALDQSSGGKQKIVSIAYGKPDGMESILCNGVARPAGWKTRDGKLWFPTSKGLAVIDSSTVKINHVPPPVYVEQLWVDKKPVMNAGAGMREEPAESEPLRIPPCRGELEFRYTALNFQAPERIRFKYKLSGVDSEWIDGGTRRLAHYNNIYPGRYRFSVLACNSDGIWNEQGDSVAIVLQPHFWQTWWFRGLGVLAAIGSVSGAARYATRIRMQRKLELLEQEQALQKERARIAQDMHDQLGAGLTQVGFLGELAKRDADKFDQTKIYAGKICETARELAQTLDEIVWAMNPKNDTLNKLAAYLAVYAEEFFRLTSIRCRLDIPPGLPSHPLLADARHNLFLTVKEALNNVVKHAQASEVRLHVSVNDSELEILIEDDGRGFAFETPDQFGNGLGNMKKRIEEIGGRFELTSRPEKGTRIYFQIPLKSGSRNDHE
ncbi:MAG TPA: two-component regulator propeller domain-containing protein [Verrucomicrobiae bacterium]|nr:two-component regulator propeller domain-containing protein [Verrucomicrobiae bacterium]